MCVCMCPCGDLQGETRAQLSGQRLPAVLGCGVGHREQADHRDTVSQVDTELLSLILDINSLAQSTCSTMRREGGDTVAQDQHSTRDLAE